MTKVKTLRSEGSPLVLLDAGNALFRSPNEAKDETARKKAQLIAQTMASLDYAAMAVGTRDLTRGVSFLKSAAQGLPLLSANLFDERGERLFPPSRTVTASGVKIGIIGVSPEGAYPHAPGVVGKDPVKAALLEAAKLRKSVDLVVVLAAVSSGEASALLEKARGSVDFIVQSSEGRGSAAVQRQAGAFLFSAGERGRTLGKLTVDVAKKGPLVDAAEADRLRERLRLLEQNEKELARRQTATKDPAAKKSLADLQANFRTQRKTLEDAGGKPPPNARLFRLSHLSLGRDIPGDAALEKAIAPFGPAAH